MTRVSQGAGTTLLVASTGGHLEELYRLHTRLVPASARVEWATFDEPQSQSLLADQVVHLLPYVAPRDYRAVFRSAAPARKIIAAGHYERVVTTGSGVALALLPAARMMHLPFHYIESAARSVGPSRTGSVVAAVPGVHLYTQYQTWQSRRWRFGGSLFDGYRAVPSITPRGAVNRVVVTLGTMRIFSFRRALTNLVRVLPEVTAPDVEILWQVGATDTTGLGIKPVSTIGADEMAAAIRDADLVVSHGGIGSALSVLDAGTCPVLLPRLRVHGEHVDDHQLLIAEELAGRRLAVSASPDELTAEHLDESRRLVISHEAAPPDFVLAQSPRANRRHTA